jgi:hypothetical protein
MAKLIRLRPLDAKKGHVIRRYTAFSNTFEEAKGWYRVSDAVAAYRATVHQVPNDEDTPLAFDVCSQEEAERIELAEKKRAEERARAADPNVTVPRDLTAVGGDLTTADLRDPGRRDPGRRDPGPRSVATAGRRR